MTSTASRIPPAPMLDIAPVPARPCQGQATPCPLDAKRLTDRQRPEDAVIRVGLAHLAASCPRCWRAVDGIAAADHLKYVTRKVIHPVVAVHQLVMGEYVPSVRLGRVLREARCQKTGALSEEGYYRLLLESWLYGYRLPVPNRELSLTPIYENWLAFMAAASMPASEALTKLWRECELEHAIAQAVVGEISVKKARATLKDWHAQKGEDEIAFWIQEHAEVRLAGARLAGARHAGKAGNAGGALEVFAGLLAGERARVSFEPVIYEYAMEVEAERWRLGEGLGLEARLNWYLRIIDARDLEADEHPCIAARAARQIEALVMAIVKQGTATATEGFEAGLLYRIALTMREIYPDLCQEWVDDYWLGRDAPWLEEIEWEEWCAYGGADDLRPVLAAGYLMLHPEDIEHPLGLPGASDIQEERFLRLLDAMSGFAVVYEVWRDGHQLAGRMGMHQEPSTSDIKEEA